MTTEKQTQYETLTRYDFTMPQQEFLLYVVRRNDVIDAIDLGCIFAKHGANFEAIADEILEVSLRVVHWDKENNHADIARNLERAKRLDETKA